MSARSIAIVVAPFLAAGLFAACAPAPTENVSDDGASALAQDEVEAQVLVNRIDSKDPDATGVDYWRLSLVKKEGSSALFAVALGFRGKKEVLDVIFSRGKDGDGAIRLEVQESSDIKVTRKLRSAVAADMDLLKEKVLEQHPTMGSTSGTSSIRIQTKSGKDCESENFTWWMVKGIQALNSGIAAAACTSAVFTAGATTLLCVHTVNMAIVSYTVDNTDEALDKCLAATAKTARNADAGTRGDASTW